MGHTAEFVLVHQESLEGEGSPEELLPALAGRHPRGRRMVPLAVGLLVLILVATTRASRLGKQAYGSESLTEVVDDAEGRMNCSMFPYLRLVNVTSRNLGGKGPDMDAPPGLIYQTQMVGGPEDGKEYELRLNLTSDSAAFKPMSVGEIGFQGKYGSINVQENSSATVEVEMFDTNASKRVPFRLLYFTFFDLDQGPNGSARESITVDPGGEAYVSNNSEVNVTKVADGGLLFEATAAGTGEDNPKDPLMLNALQFRRAVTVGIHDAPKLTITFAVSESRKRNPRWFSFRGQPTLLCARRSDNSTYAIRQIAHGGVKERQASARAVALTVFIFVVVSQLVPSG